MAEPDQELNAWRELGEEMGRVISLMDAETFADWFPDWFGPRLFDLQAKSSVALGRVPPAPAPQEEDAVVKYRVEPDDDGDWHVLTFSNGVERKIFTRSPLVIVQPEAH